MLRMSASAPPRPDASVQRQLQRLNDHVDELKRANAMLADAAEQFAGALAHDVKNPLAAIKMNVQGMKRRLERGGQLEAEQCLERLGRIDLALDQTLEQIALARARVNGVSSKLPRREPLDLAALIREVIEHYQQLRTPHRIALECQAPVVDGEWDAAQLRAVVGQLLENAIKFSPEGGDITVTLDLQPDAAVLQVRDHGLGIPARDVDHVCERFYRAENAIGRFKGAGLGLFEARAIVTAHKGSLDIDSREGSGSTITMRLPLY